MGQHCVGTYPYCRCITWDHPVGSHRVTITPEEKENMASRGKRATKIAIWSAGGSDAFRRRTGIVIGSNNTRVVVTSMRSAMSAADCTAYDILRSTASIVEMSTWMVVDEEPMMISCGFSNPNIDKQQTNGNPRVGYAWL